jgi:hypothetical protein
MQSTTYRIAEGWRQYARLRGGFLLLAAGGVLSGHMLDPDGFPLELSMLGFLFCGGVGLFALWHGSFLDAYSVEISDDGVRRISTGAWIPWSGIARLRERPLLNRVDLIGFDGRTEIALEYQLEDFRGALEQVVQRVRIDLCHDGQRFHPSRLSALQRFRIVSLIAFLGLGVWLWISEGGWVLGPAVIAMMLFFYWSDTVYEVSEVTVSGGVLSVWRGSRATSFRFGDITRADLALQPQGSRQFRLEVVVEVDGVATAIRPVGTNPFEMIVWLRSRLDDPPCGS